VRRWQVATNLIYGQVKKCYRQRKLVRVTHVMRLGTEDALNAALKGLGLSGRLNTAFIERVNLTVRHGVAALARRVVFPVIITCSFFHIVTLLHLRQKYCVLSRRSCDGSRLGG
jgi:hypothetical protein